MRNRITESLNIDKIPCLCYSACTSETVSLVEPWKVRAMKLQEMVAKLGYDLSDPDTVTYVERVSRKGNRIVIVHVQWEPRHPGHPCYDEIYDGYGLYDEEYSAPIVIDDDDNVLNEEELKCLFV
jgi:hypothetical protein